MARTQPGHRRDRFWGQLALLLVLRYGCHALMLLPVLGIFLAGQRYFVSGMLVGAVKG